MNLEQQVCTLEQAKKLSETGVIQGASLFFYDTWSTDNRLQFNTGHMVGNYKDAETCYSAFTVAELGVMLPLFPDVNWETYYKSDSIVMCHAQLDDYSFGTYATEAEARADILIHLLQSKRLKIDEVNQRLTA